MDWKQPFAGLALVLVLVLTKTPAEPPAAPASRAELAVEFGHFPVGAAWYQDVYRHEHEKVKVTPKFERDGRVEVTVGMGGLSGTDVTLVFWRDEAKSTRVAAKAIHRTDHIPAGESGIRHISGLEGRVLLKSDDWGPGKPLDCLFALRGVLGEQPQFLLGAFTVAIPASSER